MDKYLSNKVYIVICPYATNLVNNKKKEWQHWINFSYIFKKCQIIALVSKKDYKKCIIDFPNIKVFTEKLGTAAYIMKKAKYVVANDSGAMHLASFFGDFNKFNFI